MVVRTATGIEIGMSRTGTTKAKRAVSAGSGSDREDRGGAEQLVGFTFVVGVDGDQAGLGVGRALVEGEFGGEALGDRVGVAEDAGGGVEDDVLGGFGGARAFELEGGDEVGVAAGLGDGDDDAGRS